MFKKNCSSIEYQYKNLGDGFNKKRGKDKFTCPMFDNEFLAHSKQLIFFQIFYFSIQTGGHM